MEYVSELKICLEELDSDVGSTKSRTTPPLPKTEANIVQTHRPRAELICLKYLGKSWVGLVWGSNTCRVPAAVLLHVRHSIRALCGFVSGLVNHCCQALTQKVEVSINQIHLSPTGPITELTSRPKYIIQDYMNPLGHACHSSQTQRSAAIEAPAA